ncbi:hypothetical protein PAXRUDRAFT_20512 [Paxillus rubicundulus Ve08.2h10]|uniref:Uncharacterized protein n=1 Tax=Paxillus rubicundulus Ve08.2h10 TaxID=930991 RepID=A0A0D0CSA9_9AGAM|nr:hypothetical protein PAXRUDRAFT_20512 [Paxillus rubicundulus Ve08.2h10]
MQVLHEFQADAETLSGSAWRQSREFTVFCQHEVAEKLAQAAQQPPAPPAPPVPPAPPAPPAINNLSCCQLGQQCH